MSRARAESALSAAVTQANGALRLDAMVDDAGKFFGTTVSEWAEVDAWEVEAANRLPRATLTGPGWRAFATLAGGEFRFRAHASDPRIVVQRACYHVPGRWRAHGVTTRNRPPLIPSGQLSRATWARVLVALDSWIETGCKPMSRPRVIEVLP